MSFVHLHNHSEYSLLNGAIRIPDLIRKTKDWGMKAVALTDYGNIFGAVDFYLAAKKESIQPLIGTVVYHPSNNQFNLRTHRRGIDYLFQLVLIIQNRQGYQNLCRLITKSYLEGFYYKPRIDTHLLSEFSEGLIALSAGWNGSINHYVDEGQYEKASEALRTYKQIFSDRFYVELQENGVEGQHETNLALIKLAQEEGVPVVASNNCHYIEREDAEAFETLLCIQTGATLHGARDHLKFSTDEYYFKSPEQMMALFDYAPQAIQSTLEIAASCDFEFELNRYHFPQYDPPKKMSLDDYLKEEAQKGLEKRWSDVLRNRGLNIPYDNQDGGQEKASTQVIHELKAQYQKRLVHELEVIQKMGFSGYFLIVSDFIRYAKNNQIPVGPGRGSAAGSLVAYCVQITDLDPIPYDLLFERFLNPERISMPDVDIDFCMNGRDQVLSYVTQKYGNVSQIITFGKMKARAVIRDVGRVMEIPYSEVDKIAKLIPNSLNITLHDALVQEPRLRELAAENDQIHRLIEIAKRLEGLNRHASTHAAGVVISDEPLTNLLPLYKGSNDDVVTQYDMKAVEKIGLIKFDFLGLKTLTVIHDALKIIKRTRGIDLNILDISLNDKDVYSLISRGDAAGIFQLESSGMKDLMVRMKPNCFEDLIALVALYRPGPLGSGMVDDFINRKQGLTHIVYELPELKSILEDTYGVIVYQEQVMQISSVLAGYSLGEADILRRAMGKKKAEEMASQRLRFLQGALDNKVPKEKAEKIFDLMAKFAEYGFNKSHSAAYALVSYQTAYLKTHYPVEYLAALLTTEMHNTDRILFYLLDCESHGIKVLPPDINESFYGFSVVSDTEIRYGLGAVKNLGQSAIESIVATRKSEGCFKSFYHFCNSIDHHKVNRRVLESLIKCGAMDAFHQSRNVLFHNIDSAIEMAVKNQRDLGLGQESLFNMMESDTDSPVWVLNEGVDEWTAHEKLNFEKEALGLYLSGHPLKLYEVELRNLTTTDTKKCCRLPRQSEVTLGGIVTQSKIITTKKGKRMAFVTLEDLQGSIEVILFSDVWNKCQDILTLEKPLIIKGIMDRAEESYKILAREIYLLTDYMSQTTRSIHFRVPALKCSEARLKDLHEILDQFPGSCQGYLHVIECDESETVLELPQKISIDQSDYLISKVNNLFEERVVEYTF